MGGEHADHQRRHARAAPHRHRDGRRPGGHGHRCGVAQQRRPRRGRGAGARRRGGRPRRAGRRGRAPLVTPSRCRPTPRVGRPAGRDLHRRLRRARARRSARRSSTPGRAAATCSASPSTSCTRRTSAPRPACGVRHAQPTGRIEVTGKTADWSRSSWVGQSTRDFTDVDMSARGRRAGPPARLGGAPRRPARRPLRDAAAAERGRRPDGLPCTGRPWRATPTTAGRCSADQAAAPGSVSSSPTQAAAGVERPGAPGHRVRPVRVRHLVRRVAVGLRQRPAARRDGLDRATASSRR